MKETKEAKEMNISIPNNVEIKIIGDKLIVKGPKGETTKKLADPKLIMEVQGKKFRIKQMKFSRKEKKVVNTFISHIKNLITGVTQGYVYKLKICSTHFPISVSSEGQNIIIKNFFGEKIPRKARILQNVQVKIEKDIITLEGVNKENVGQTAANIEQACRITNRDKRVFKDGCWIIQKAGEDV